MKIARNIILLALTFAFVWPVAGQTIGDFKMDETELYAMTKQMGQFMRRFNYVEQKAREQGRALQDMSLKEMDELWNEAKKTEK